MDRPSKQRITLLTAKELALQLQCSVPAIRVWSRQGMPRRKLGRLARYELEPVLRWHERRAGNSDDRREQHGPPETAAE